ncbi:hypothetical protein F4778DRAFT_619470 [Xylariomycetidae sp. FL2044]|nr:hypothetical protein F4778DRAFT_619470 [Xylariomycetidae sp. FL2044]
MTMLHLASSRPKDDGSYAAGHQRAVDSFGSTADYHSSLLDQQRQAQSGHKSPVSHRPSSSQATNTSSPLRQWLQLPGNKKTACPTCPRPWKKEKKSQRRPPLTRDVAPLPHRELSRQELDEFEALPIAIRRKIQ